jgi:LysM repeat protein
MGVAWRGLRSARVLPRRQDPDAVSGACPTRHPDALRQWTRLPAGYAIGPIRPQRDRILPFLPRSGGGGEGNAPKQTIFSNIFGKDEPKKADFSNVSGEAEPKKADFSNVQTGVSSTAPPAGAAARTYTVKSGDTLSKIAKEHYGEAGKWRAIFEANRDKIKDPDLIHPGQVLDIPNDA